MEMSLLGTGNKLFIPSSQERHLQFPICGKLAALKHAFPFKIPNTHWLRKVMYSCCTSLDCVLNSHTPFLWIFLSPRAEKPIHLLVFPNTFLWLVWGLTPGGKPMTGALGSQTFYQGCALRKILKGAQCSEPAKPRVPSTWLLCKN